MSFKILKNNCCGLDVHKTWIYACIGITDSLKRTEYKEAHFSSFSKCLQELCEWLYKYNCTDVCMESTGKYWIPVFNVLEKNNIWVTLSHPKYTIPPQKTNKTDRKNVRYKTPIEEIQAAVDDAISKEQAVKLRQCLNQSQESCNCHLSYDPDRYLAHTH